MATSIYLEVGSKKTFAAALDWPGWARSGKTEEAAIEALAAYAERYAPVAAEAGVRFPKSAGNDFDVVERVKGSATTDFGALGEPAKADAQKLTKAQAERLAAFVEASWTTLAKVAKTAPAELRKGPRGGGRDRDKMLAHVAEADAGYARLIGVKMKVSVDDAASVQAMRTAVLDELRAARAPLPDITTKAWPYRYAARRFAWHALDHAWEMQDRSE